MIKNCTHIVMSLFGKSLNRMHAMNVSNGEVKPKHSETSF